MLRWTVVMSTLALAARASPTVARTFHFNVTMRDGAVRAARAYAPWSTDGAGVVDRAPTAADVGAGAFAAVLYARGGCFSEGGVASHAAMARDLAARGVVVVAVDFRQGAAHPWPAALRDLGDAAAAARALALGLPLGVAGSSSGGFHALALAADPAAWGATGGPFAFCLALCPVFDPLARASYLRACVAGAADDVAAPHDPARAAEMLTLQGGYFAGGDAEMRAAADLVRGPRGPTPVFAVLGGADRNVPPHVTAIARGAPRTCARRLSDAARGRPRAGSERRPKRLPRAERGSAKEGAADPGTTVPREEALAKRPRESRVLPDGRVAPRRRSCRAPTGRSSSGKPATSSRSTSTRPNSTSSRAGSAPPPPPPPPSARSPPRRAARSSDALQGALAERSIISPPATTLVLRNRRARTRARGCLFANDRYLPRLEG